MVSNLALLLVCVCACACVCVCDCPFNYQSDSVTLLQVAIGIPEKTRRFGMQSGQDRYFDNLIKFFPEEEAVIRKYEQLISVSAPSLISVREKKN